MKIDPNDPYKALVVAVALALTSQDLVRIWAGPTAHGSVLAAGAGLVTFVSCALVVFFIRLGISLGQAQQRRWTDPDDLATDRDRKE